MAPFALPPFHLFGVSHLHKRPPRNRRLYHGPLILPILTQLAAAAGGNKDVQKALEEMLTGAQTRTLEDFVCTQVSVRMPQIKVECHVAAAARSTPCSCSSAQCW